MVIEVRSIFKHFPLFEETNKSTVEYQTVLKGIEFTVQDGSTLLIMGPSGSGKTTLLEILTASLQPTTGNIIINNIDIFNLKSDELEKIHWNTIGYLKQDLSSNFIDDFSFRQLIEFFSHNPLYNESSIKDFDELYDYLELLGLTQLHLDVKYHHLSGGEKQRIALLFLIFKNPSIFILDEPTSYLDEDNKLKLITILNKLKKENKTIIITSHDQIFYKIVDDIFFLKDGTISSQNILKIMPELISGSITLPLGKIINNSIALPYFIQKVFSEERILKVKIIHEQQDLLLIEFSILSKKEFKLSKIENIYFHEKDTLNFDEFRLINDVQLIEEKKSYWIIDKEKITLNISLRN